MGVVNLNHGIVRQIVEGGTFGQSLIQYQARSVAYHEILLIDAEYAACPVAVIGIEKKGEVFFNVRLVEGYPSVTSSSLRVSTSKR